MKRIPPSKQRGWTRDELYGLPRLWSEDFQHDRLYGTVRVVDPFR